MFGIGLLVLGFFLPFFKTIIDGISSNTTGVLSWTPATPFATMIINLAPIYFPIIVVIGLLLALSRKNKQDQNGG